MRPVAGLGRTTVVSVTMVIQVSAGRTGTLNMPNVFPISNGDQVELVARQEYQGSIVLNVLHYQAHIVGADIPTGREELINLRSVVLKDTGSIGEQIREQQVESLRWKRLTAQKVFPFRVPYTSENIDIPGAIAGDGVPSNVNAVITKRSAIVGRGRSGALHIAGFPIAELDGALITPSLEADLAVVGSDMALDVPMLSSGAFWRPVVGVKKTMADDEAWMIAALVQQEVRVMVRRTAFRGI